MHRSFSYMSLFWILLLGGCGDSISTPLPQPLPVDPNPELVRASTPSQENAPTLVMGLPGAVDGQGTVHLREVEGAAEQTAQTTAQGAFNLTLNLTTPGAQVEARFETPDGQLSGWVLVAGAMRNSPHPNLEPSDGPSPVSAPDSQGMVTVRTLVDQGLFFVEPEIEVLVANLQSGATASTVSDTEGAFSVQIAASSGQTIAIFLADREEQELTSDFLTFPVP